MTYIELFKFCVEKLKNLNFEEAESDTRLLFYYLLNADRNFLFMNGDKEVSDDKCEEIYAALDLRIKHIPLQHITGKQNFMGLEFFVNSDVLIPRFDTETLVEEAMILSSDGDKVLDVCTGSGCILISLMKYKNDIKGFGCDISEKALKVAEKNAYELLCKPNGWADAESEVSNPKFIQSDLFENIDEKNFDIIVSNPPYIRSAVIPTLSEEVKDHDPMLALDGGTDGLEFYRIIIDKSREHLCRGGSLLVEIGHDQGDSVSDLFNQNGYKDVRVVKDLGGLDRVVIGKYFV